MPALFRASLVVAANLDCSHAFQVPGKGGINVHSTFCSAANHLVVSLVGLPCDQRADSHPSSFRGYLLGGPFCTRQAHSLTGEMEHRPPVGAKACKLHKSHQVVFVAAANHPVILHAEDLIK